MINREEKRLRRKNEEKELFAQEQEESKNYWSHWRAWGSWFSWGSPVGLGLFFILAAISAAILIWVIKL